MRRPSFETKENGVPILCQNQIEAIAEGIVRELSPRSFAGQIDATDLHRLLAAMEGWMHEMGLVFHLRELGVTEEMLEGIADGSTILRGGYKVLTRSEVMGILRESM